MRQADSVVHLFHDRLAIVLATGGRGAGRLLIPHFGFAANIANIFPVEDPNLIMD